MRRRKDLYIFIHLLKTGGSSLRRLIEINTKEEERMFLKADKYPIKKGMNRKNYLLSQFEKDLKKVDKNKINFIYGHGVPFGIHKYFSRDYKYIVFFRSPISRTLSLYNFNRNRYIKAIKTKGNTKHFEDTFLVNKNIPNFYDWLVHKYRRNSTVIETVTQHLKAQGYLTGFSDKNIKKMFDKFYFVGIVKYLDSDINFLCGKLGFNKFLVKQNVSKKYIKEVKDKKTLKLLKEKNKNDIKLYEYAVKKRNKFIKNNKDYYKLANETEFKRKFLLPFTQVLYDPKGSLIDLSAYLKRRFPLYERVFDYVRGYRHVQLDEKE